MSDITTDPDLELAIETLKRFRPSSLANVIGLLVELSAWHPNDVARLAIKHAPGLCFHDRILCPFCGHSGRQLVS